MTDTIVYVVPVTEDDNFVYHTEMHTAVDTLVGMPIGVARALEYQECEWCATSPFLRDIKAAILEVLDLRFPGDLCKEDLDTFISTLRRDGYEITYSGDEGEEPCTEMNSSQPSASTNA
jgi:hypothetical protein